ncbi:MAG: site-specific integrase [Pirellulales bacterium]
MAKAKPKTIHNDVVAIKQLVNFAVRRKMIHENPLAELKLKKPKNSPQPYWMRDQVELILKSTSPRYQALFHFLADTGTRIGEARWLTWDDVDFSNKFVHIRPKDGWQPKTGDQRVIHLSDDLHHVLSKLPRSSKWVFTAPRTERFPTGDRQISARRALAHLKTVLKKIGLPGHLHTFRHSFISHALIAGAKESVVREWVGHVDPEIMKIYIHIADKYSRSAMHEILPGKGPSHGGDGAHAGGSDCAQNVHRKEDCHE